MATEQFVVVQLGSEEYALPKAKVRVIMGTYWGASKLPYAPEYIEGIVHMRGKVIPIMDLAKRLGMTISETDDKHAVMAKQFGLALVKTESKMVVIVEAVGLELGLVVDEVKEVQEIEASTIELASPCLTPFGRFIRGVGKLDDRLLTIIDLDKLFSYEEKDAVVTAVKLVS